MKTPYAFLLALACLSCLGLGRLQAESNFAVLNSFTIPSISVPSALVKDAAGNFYGTTPTGGLPGLGTVFRATPEGEITTLVVFNGANGASPGPNLLLGADGNLYGTTPTTLFKVTPSGVLTTLASNLQVKFLIQGSANDFIYGATPTKIFRISLTGQLTNLSFTADVITLIQSPDGNLYGATPGKVFKMTPGGAVTTVKAMSVQGLILGSDGLFYGTTGTSIFRMTPAGVVTTLFTGDSSTFQYGYDSTEVNGFVPAPNGTAYFTISSVDVSYYPNEPYVEENHSFLYKVPPKAGSGTAYDQVFDGGRAGGLDPYTISGFGDQDGHFFLAGYNQVINADETLKQLNVHDNEQALIGDASGNVYGVNSDTGGFFHLYPDNGYANLSYFRTMRGGYAPVSPLLLGKDGNFYGTTSKGEAADLGTVFRMTPDGVVTTLVAFNKTNGATPIGGLIQGSDGNFYGTTSAGGTYNMGTLFRMTPAGALTTLVTFNGVNGALPLTALCAGPDGNFYGTTGTGGIGVTVPGTNGGNGTIFRLTPAGQLTTLVAPNYAMGSAPNGLLLASDGKFYGTMQYSGANGYGNLFQLTTAGDFQVLFSFGMDCGNPAAALIQGTDGTLYGTASDVQYRYNYREVIFRYSLSGGLAQIGSVVINSGATPHLQALVQATDGSFYGSDSGTGSIFRAVPSGASLKITQLAIAGSPSGLIFGTNGRLYGTDSGGIGGGGDVFRVVPPAPQTVTLAPIPDHNPTDPPFTVSATASSGLAVNYGVSGPATISGNTVTLTGTSGVVTVRASQAGDSLHQSATTTQSFTVRQTQAISFPVIPAHYLNDPPFAISATASSGLPVTFSLVSGPATLSGSTITLAGTAGTVVVQANQAGNATYAPTSTAQSFTVFLLAQKVTFTALPTNPLVGTTLTLQATASSGLPITFSATGPATLSGNQLTLTGPGRVTVVAKQAGNATYAAVSSTQNLLVKAMQSITFPAIPAQVNGGSYTLTATASSKLAVTYSVTGPATLSGNVLTFTGAGKVSVKASQVGNATYAAAADVTQTVTVAKAAQTITFPAIPDQTYPGGPVTLQATTTSGLAVTYAVSGAATLSGNRLTLTGPGTVNVTARQAGDANFLSATAVALRFKVTQGK